MNFYFFNVFLTNRDIISKNKRSKVTDYAALISLGKKKKTMVKDSYLLKRYMLFVLCDIFIPPANFVCRGYTVFTLSVRQSVRPSVRPSVRNALFP